MKPGNLLRSRENVVKLADFGIAKATEDSNITQVGSVLGTAAYLAPEQARGEEAGPAADLYALGVVTYQFLSGRLPYEATSLTELALKQQREVPARLDASTARCRPSSPTRSRSPCARSSRALRHRAGPGDRPARRRAGRSAGHGRDAGRGGHRGHPDGAATSAPAEPRRVPREPIPPPPRRAAPAPAPAPGRAGARARGGATRCSS